MVEECALVSAFLVYYGKSLVFVFSLNDLMASLKVMIIVIIYNGIHVTRAKVCTVSDVMGLFCILFITRYFEKQSAKDCSDLRTITEDIVKVFWFPEPGVLLSISTPALVKQ